MINRFTYQLSGEVLFQMILISVLFLAVAFEKGRYGVNTSEVFFLINYICAALTISYFLLPRFFYKKKYIHFSIGVLAVLTVVILIEELVLEKVFYPDSRGGTFPGVVFTLMEVLPVILALVGFKFAWDAQKKQNELEQLNTIVAESRLQFLKSQINPHFLFNNLNNLYAYALEQSPKTPTIILELSSLLRYMLYDCQEHLVPLQKELDSLRNFIRLQELQIEDRGDVILKISGETRSQLIAPMILVVFIENCFKHCTSSQVEGIQINIELDISDGVLDMKCENTYSLNTNTQELSKGIGLENVKTRLELLYPNSHSLTISQTDELFNVHLTINLSEAK